MRSSIFLLLFITTCWLISGTRLAAAQISATGGPDAAAKAGISLDTGWKLLNEGEADGAIEQDAKHASSMSPHLLRIAVTKTAAPGKGRAGAANSTPIAVQDGQWYDIVFSAITERGSIGLVFSLEGADGKVLARTTLPEIGRGRRGPAAPGGVDAGSPWRKYTVSLHARATDPMAHLVITPIEPTNIWLDGLMLTPRATSGVPLK